MQVFFRQDMACVSWPNLIKIGRWKVNEMSSRFDDKKRLRRIRPSPPPPFCLHYADRTQNILSVVAPWPVQATKFGPHRLWFAGVIFFSENWIFGLSKWLQYESLSDYSNLMYLTSRPCSTSRISTWVDKCTNCACRYAGTRKKSRIYIRRRNQQDEIK